MIAQKMSIVTSIEFKAGSRHGAKIMLKEAKVGHLIFQVPLQAKLEAFRVP